MGDLQDRVAALSPERLELVARRIARHYGRAAEPQQIPVAAEAAPPIPAQIPADVDPEVLLATVSELPDVHVDLLLRQMLGEPDAVSVQKPTPEEVLEKMADYSDADVDLLIAELLAAQNESDS